MHLLDMKTVCAMLITLSATPSSLYIKIEITFVEILELTLKTHIYLAELLYMPKPKLKRGKVPL